MSHVGQNAKYPVRADVFRFALELGHCAKQRALRIWATSGLMLCFVDDPPVVFPERLPRPRTVVGHLHVEGLAPTLQHVAIRRAERIRCGVASLWAATREAAEGFSGSRRPTSLRCSFHPLTHFGTNPSPPFLQTCPFLPLTSTRPCRHRELAGKRRFGCRHPYRGGRSTPFVEFCRPPFGAR